MTQNEIATSCKSVAGATKIVLQRVHVYKTAVTPGTITGKALTLQTGHIAWVGPTTTTQLGMP